jgi:hypothetical protein
MKKPGRKAEHTAILHVRITPAQRAFIDEVEKVVGIPVSEQVRRGLELWRTFVNGLPVPVVAGRKS